MMTWWKICRVASRREEKRGQQKTTRSPPLSLEPHYLSSLLKVATAVCSLAHISCTGVTSTKYF